MSGWRGLAIALGVLATACSSATAPAKQSAEKGSETAVVTSIAPDPEVVIGQLDNGLTYYLRSNGRPGGSLELRLVIRAGSLHEEDLGSGIAHFTEHMLFNGTTAYPGNSLNEALRDLGTEFGPDLNAYTSHDETVFELSMPSTDDATITEAFVILDEWAERALISEADTVAERGVIREEFRLRAESYEGVLFESFDTLYTSGTRYSGRSPIGTEAAIESTTADQVRRFYDRWYRPDLMAIVAVGDVDVARLEAEILERFSDNVARVDEPPGVVEVDAAPISDPHVEVVAAPDAAEGFVSLDVGLPLRTKGTVEGERLLLLDEVVAALIQQRLGDLVSQGGSEVVRPVVGNFEYTRARRFLGFNFAAEDEAAGLTEVLGELQAASIVGFSESELNRVVADLRTGVDQVLAGAGSRQDRAFADSYVEHFLSGHAIDSAADVHERLSRELDDLDPAGVSAHFAEVWAGSAPLVIVVGDESDPLPTEDELWSAIATAREVTVSAVAARGDASLPDPPRPVKERDRVVHDDLSAFELRFPNGVRVLFRYSDVDRGRVEVWAESLGGWSLLEAGDGALVDTVTEAVALSGVGDLDTVDLDIALSGADVALTPYIGATEEGFVGGGAADDLGPLLQLLALRLEAPRVEPGALVEAVEASRTRVRQVGTDPSVTSYVELLDARTGGDPWYRLLPTLDELGELVTTEALALYERRFGTVDDLVVVIVGDVDATDVTDAARRHLGTLAGGEQDTWIDRLPEAPSGVTSRAVGAGLNDSGAGFDLMMVTEGSLTTAQQQALAVLDSVLNDRLVEQVREQLGASYGGGQVFSEVVIRPRDLVDVVVSVSGDPERVDELHKVVLGVVADVAATGPSQEEFERARRVVQADLDTYSNWDLMNELMDRARRGSSGVTLAGSYAAVAGLERSDVADVARLVLHLEDRIEVFRRP